jgi:hypothetical protein
MTIKYTIEVRDLLTFRKYVRLKTPQGKRVRTTMMFLIVAVALFLTMTAKLDNLGQQIIYFLLCCGIFVVLNKFINWVFARIAEWRMLTPEKQKGLLCEHTVTLAEEAIIETTSVDENRKLWNGVFMVVRDEEYIYIFLTPQMAHIVPVRAFASADLADSFFKRASELHARAVAV